ncbi:protein DpdH [Paraburkholderia unamae]|uniref:ORC1/DEAH AAA+ ATPase domain-containing protein n=1 Tax=Paraburkholderia unamae TaxID=219649 RepID=A0ABX5KVR7_9BURK|nr:protein DpdH [Paraburkholderia unamae]PVX97689.1 hypothetical protein C7402_101403 [Paraburkholderia unamae]
MSDTMNPLSEYWPSSERIAACLRTEAETVDQALLLAVHQTVTLRQRSAQSGTEEPATENDLLDALMRPVNDGSAVIVAITGASGVGKSHMVRWLGAQLDRHPRREDLIVVSIPKTASLRRVVQLILKPLRGEQYVAMREELDRAAESLDMASASEMLGTALAQELEILALQLKEQSKATKNFAEGARIVVADHLRNLIRDPDILDRWFKHVLQRIVRSSLEGTGEPELRQFQPSDFIAPDAVSAGGDLRDVVNRALAHLSSANGIHRETAAKVLQEVLDPALRKIFRFTEALKQRTIGEVVSEIRTQLLADGKELVLLIEDLAALSGIQQPLLDIMIAECDEKGLRVRAPIRTAVAVTDGFLIGRQTVLTRAKVQWVVPSEGIDEATVVRLLVELTGRYLNAARWGIERLKDDFETAERNAADLYSWVPTFEPVIDAQASTQLREFGRSAAGYSLFPFNKASIRSLGASVLKVDNAWRFNPRAFINEVLTKTLSLRDSFEKAAFPPARFRNTKLRAEMSVALEHLHLGTEVQGRMESLLFHWAGDPKTLSEATSLSPEVFKAFSLPLPYKTNVQEAAEEDQHRKEKQDRVEPDTDNKQDEQAPKPIDTAPAERPSDYALAMEAWDIEHRLTNDASRRTRNLLADALNRRLDPDDWCLHGQKVEAGWFWLPPAHNINNPSKAPMIRLSPPDVPIPPRLIAGLKALDRWEVKGKTWDYPGGDDDYASADAVLVELERKVLDLMFDESIRDASIAMHALHRQNLLLGITSRPDNPGLKDLFTAMPTEVKFDAKSLDSVTTKALDRRERAMGGRAQLQDRLKKYLACYQGNLGDKVLAIDTERLRLASKRELEQKWSFALKGRAAKDSDDVLDTLERLSPQSIDMLLRELAAAVNCCLPETADAFDAEHGRVAWREEMKGVVDQAVLLSFWPPGDFGQPAVRAAIDRLSVDGVDSVVARLRKMQATGESTDTHRQLAALSAVPLPRLVAIHQDVMLLRNFLSALGKSVDQQTTSIDDQAAIHAHEDLMTNLAWEK